MSKPEKTIPPAGTVEQGGTIVPSDSLAVVAKAADIVPAELQAYLDTKAREINVTRATLYVRVGAILAEVRLHCKLSQLRARGTARRYRMLELPPGTARAGGTE